MESRQMIIQSVMQVLKSKVDQETLDIVQDALTIELNRYEVRNERIMIPAMFAMIKSQKEQLDRQEKLINQLYEKFNIEKEN